MVQIVFDLLNDLRALIEAPAHRWVISEAEGRCRLVIDETVAFANVQRAAFTSHVVSTLTRQVLDVEPESLHLHAMAVVANGSTLVAAGPSGAGKSTLCTALLQLGAAYVTDEAVAVEPSNLTITAFPKPIVVKRLGIGNVAGIIETQPPSDSLVAWTIPASSIGSLAPAMPHRVGTIVAYRRTPNGPAQIAAVHRATLCHQLLTDSPDIERFGGESLHVAARLVASANCFQASGNDAAEIADELLRHHGEPFTPGVVQNLPMVTGDSGPVRVPELFSVIVDGRALSMDPTTGQLAELDEPTTAWWRLLDGTPIDTLIGEITEATGLQEDEVSSIGHAMVAQLRQAGLVRPG